MDLQDILLQSDQELVETNGLIITLNCKRRNHTYSLNKYHFYDKFKEEQEPFQVCLNCKREEKYKDLLTRLENKFGFSNFEIRKENDVSYICKCGFRVPSTSIRNLENSKGFCQNCEKKSRVISLENVLSRVEKTVLFLEGYRVDVEKGIKNNKSIPMICPIGHSYLGHLSNMEKGQSKCQVCRELKKKK